MQTAIFCLGFSLATVLTLSACTSTGRDTQPAQSPISSNGAGPQASPTNSAITSPGTSKPSSASGVQEAEFSSALTAPLSDLNLLRTPIPETLAAAQKNPYAEPTDDSCTGLAQDIAALNRVLGADLDTPPSAGNPGLLERGSDLATHAVISAVRDSTTSILPFRGWIRRLTGAEKHARAVIAAISAGAVRRAYLKGLGQAQGCPAPAAPALIKPPAGPTAQHNPQQVTEK
jgi:hypothetical protein